MHIGILQTGSPPEELQEQYGGYDTMLVRLLEQHHAEFEFSVFRALDGQIPDDLLPCEGWLITGSRFSVYGAQAWISPLKVFIRKIIDAGQPLAGICFGHQIIAEALGGRVEKSSKGWGLGLDTYSDSGASPLGVLGNMTLNIFHQDQVVELPPGAQIFARSDFCEYAGMFIGDQVVTIQAHPEYTTRFNRELLKVRKSSVIPDALAQRAIETLGKSDVHTDSQRFGAHLADFFISHRIT